MKAIMMILCSLLMLVVQAHASEIFDIKKIDKIVDVGGLRTPVLELYFISKVKDITINNILINDGNSNINCNIDKLTLGPALPVTLGLGQKFECFGRPEVINEIQIDTDQYGTLYFPPRMSGTKNNSEPNINKDTKNEDITGEYEYIESGYSGKLIISNQNGKDDGIYNISIDTFENKSGDLCGYESECLRTMSELECTLEDYNPESDDFIMAEITPGYIEITHTFGGLCGTRGNMLGKYQKVYGGSTNPQIKGFQLGMIYEDAIKLANELKYRSAQILGGSINLDNYGSDDNRALTIFGFEDDAIRKLFNTNTIDDKFLEEFVAAYKIKGKKIPLHDFLKRFVDPERVRQQRAVSTMVGFKGDNKNIIYDCGDYAVIFHPEYMGTGGYLYIHEKQKDTTPLPRFSGKKIFD